MKLQAPPHSLLWMPPPLQRKVKLIQQLISRTLAHQTKVMLIRLMVMQGQRVQTNHPLTEQNRAPQMKRARLLTNRVFWMG
jgi:hypothetical protein